MNQYIGHEFQCMCVEEHRLIGGKGDGMRLLIVRNGIGLELTISLDRNADISRLTYQGLNMNFMSPCGYVHPSYYDKDGLGFLKSFTAGFLTTCGLYSAGSPCVDKGDALPLHGNISNIPVEQYSYEINSDEILIKTVTLDEVIFAHKYQLFREFHISLKRNAFYYIDHISNRGDVEGPLMVLYHINLGYPLLSENALVYISSNKIEPRDEWAKSAISEYDKMSRPIMGMKERCYFHKFDKNPVASVYNPIIKKGISITFDNNNLEYLTEWKMMGVRDYALGLEPGNCTPEGRDIIRKKNKLVIIKPNETISYRVNIECFDNKNEFLKLQK